MPQNGSQVGEFPTPSGLPSSVADQLADLGLTPEDIDYACRQAILAMDRVSDLATRNYRGTTFWSALVEFLRDRLIPRGWDYANVSGYDVVIHPDRTHAIVVTRGDRNTGKKRSPRTYARKGHNTRRLVQQNVAQKNLFGALGISSSAFVSAQPKALPGLEGMSVWMLLFSRNEMAGLVEMELSLPEEVDGDQRPAGWSRRIPLDAVPYVSAITVDMPENSAQEPETIEIEIERRNHGS